MTLESSRIQSLCLHLADHPDGQAMLSELLSRLSDIEAIALHRDWEATWARPSQVLPKSNWTTWGVLTGRGWGKTRAISEWVLQEILDGRAKRVALIAQNEDNVKGIQIDGESGLATLAPPWCKPDIIGDVLHWPNGAKCFVLSPEAPDSIFGEEYDLAWATELHAWNRSKMGKAWANLGMSVRLGYGRIVWDSNPRRRHPIIKDLLSDAQRNPRRHIVVRGASHENRYNLTPGKIAEWESKYGGTQLGREMLLGEQTDEEDGALWISATMIEPFRSDLQLQLERIVIGVDPAISTREGTDATGIIEVGVDSCGRSYVLDDYSGCHAWDEIWKIVASKVLQNRVDVVVIERNRGGDACLSSFRRACQDIDITVLESKLEAHARRHTGIVWAKEVVSRSSKETRAEAVLGPYKDGMVAHSTSGSLAALEGEMTTWVPSDGGDSPNRIDALVHALWETLGLFAETRATDKKKEAHAASQIMKQIQQANPKGFAFGGMAGRAKL